jgi:hypothetical protein
MASQRALATSPRWTRSQSLDLVYRLNEQCLELIAGLATLPVGNAWQLVSANRELWIKLGPDARKRAARLPFVIVDLHFADEEWWRRLADVPTSDARAPDATNGLPRELNERLVTSASYSKRACLPGRWQGPTELRRRFHSRCCRVWPK